MGKVKKIKKLMTRGNEQARELAERAERAASRAEAAEQRMHDVQRGRAVEVGTTDLPGQRAAFHTAPAAETR